MTGQWQGVVKPGHGIAEFGHGKRGKGMDWNCMGMAEMGRVMEQHGKAACRNSTGTPPVAKDKQRYSWQCLGIAWPVTEWHWNRKELDCAGMVRRAKARELRRVALERASIAKQWRGLAQSSKGEA